MNLPYDQREPTTFVTFIVGDDEPPAEFMVHKEVVCYHSSVLKAAVNTEQFVEGQTQAYTLTDVSEDTFRLFVQWLYGQKTELQQLEQDFDSTRAESKQIMKDEGLSLVELWVLADKFAIPQLQNQTIKTINSISIQLDMIAISVLVYVDESTSEDSKLRKYYIDSCARYLDAAVYRKKAGRFPKGMLIQILGIITQERDILIGVSDGDASKAEEFPVTNYLVKED